jgi:hypothetical protein
MLLFFLKGSERYSHEIVGDDRAFNYSVGLWVEHVGRHLWLSPEVKKYIENFEVNHSN